MSITAFLRSQQARFAVATTVFAGGIDWFGARTGAAERRVKELYITPYDVQTQPMIFFNIRLAPMLKTWYTFRKLRNRRGRWLEERRAGGRTGST